MDEAIADKIEAQPELLEIAQTNIARWLAQNHSAPHRLKQWREIILEAQGSAEGLRRLLAILRDPGEEATHLRSFAPFPGVLSIDERRELLCSHKH
ncbi:MAG TPA: hypothetical protein VNW28_10480 [Chthoniobacterales bacterium]|nr:hypothetical protein [Chthoniobacterales bacterium]